MKTNFTVIAVTFAFLVSCAHMKEPSAQLENTVHAFWSAKQDKQWEKAYGFYCQAYRSEVSKSNFIQTPKLDVLSFQIKGITYSEDGKQARVSVVFDALIQGNEFKGIKLKERWSYEDNEWRFSPEKKTFKDHFKKNL